ncbi:ATP-binding protein [Streptomyces sp. XM4193]|uniref:ATP-binding protein n=1 Tax=Streptomyces sp. XM4193 TaxID=2929782 RepID=UPI001FFB1BEC|nr:ATP-binding protein [Streptomyces sp. XM4193]MCK1798598.1 ATP-binding protein [Streptomyces sp. XM4193]
MTPQPVDRAAHHGPAASGGGPGPGPTPLSLVEGLVEDLPVLPGPAIPPGSACAMSGRPTAAPGSAAHEPQDSSAFAVWTLGEGSRSAALARSYAHNTLRCWGLKELDDSVAVAVSEMVTNAMRHNREPDAGAGPRPVLLGLARQGRGVLCVVVDAGAGSPQVCDAAELAESGRGLHIVECLSDDWGWTVPGPTGKAVWASFSTPASDGPAAPDRDSSRDTAVPASGALPQTGPEHRGPRGRARAEALGRVLLLAGVLCGTGDSRPPAVVHPPRTRS